MVEAVITSVNCGDFLAATLAENQSLLDNVVVVTSPDDHETQSVCRRHSVHFVITEDHKIGGPFNKARLIQRGMDQMGGHDWILHLDADVVLPRKFRRLVDWANLDVKTIYGADRCNLIGWDNWRSLKAYADSWDNHAHECGHWFHPKCQMGSRWVSSLHGYCPIGFFQLFHSSQMFQNGYHVRKYPYTHADAARTDVQFSLQWDRKYRAIIPEVVVLHLESEPAELGINWDGRKTKRFGPEPGLEPAHQKPPSHRDEPRAPQPVKAND